VRTSARSATKSKRSSLDMKSGLMGGKFSDVVLGMQHHGPQTRFLFMPMEGGGCGGEDLNPTHGPRQGENANDHTQSQPCQPPPPRSLVCPLLSHGRFSHM
jgi:hypothetical protein